MLENTPNQPSKFRTKNWADINKRGMKNTNSQTKFKTSMLKSSLCDYYSDAYAHVKGTITIPNTGTAADPNNKNNRDIKIIFKNGTPFTDSISEINNTQVYNAKDVDVVMTMNDDYAYISRIDVEIMVLLKYLSNFCSNLAMPLINCEINLILTWFTNYFISARAAANQYQHLQYLT